MGNALSHAALGPASPVSRDIWTQEQNNGTEAVQSPEGASGERRDWLEWLLTRILQEEVTNQNPHRRQVRTLGFERKKQMVNRTTVSALLLWARANFTELLKQKKSMKIARLFYTCY